MDGAREDGERSGTASGRSSAAGLDAAPGGAGETGARVSRRVLGGSLVAVGSIAVLAGIYLIAADLWPDGEITPASFLFDVLLLVVPGLALIGAGAVIGREQK